MDQCLMSYEAGTVICNADEEAKGNSIQRTYLRNQKLGRPSLTRALIATFPLLTSLTHRLS